MIRKKAFFVRRPGFGDGNAGLVKIAQEFHTLRILILLCRTLVPGRSKAPKKFGFSVCGIFDKQDKGLKKASLQVRRDFRRPRLRCESATRKLAPPTVSVLLFLCLLLEAVLQSQHACRQRTVSNHVLEQHVDSLCQCYG